MELTIKEKVLLAIYNEYQKDVPDMEHNITWDKLEIDKQKFEIAIDKLENENLIVGEDIRRNGHNEILMVFLSHVKPSMRGIVYVEDKWTVPPFLDMFISLFIKVADGTG